MGLLTQGVEESSKAFSNCLHRDPVDSHWGADRRKSVRSLGCQGMDVAHELFVIETVSHIIVNCISPGDKVEVS